MLEFQSLIGRPWAVTGEIAEYARRLFEVDLRAFADLRGLVELRATADAATRAAAVRPSQGAGVAVIPVLGLLTQRGGFINCAPTASSAQLAQDVRAAAENAAVQAIVLEIDSPGGEVYGIPEAAAVIRDARGSKPIVAIANSVAASGAYWLASQADEVMVTPSGQVGSVGVYAAHEDRSKALEAEGKKVTFISAGKYKTEGNPYEPLGDEGRSAMQAEVNRYYGMFTGDVARGRSTNVDAVRNGFGEGRMVGARAAVEQGMADAVGTLEDAVRRATALGAERRRQSEAAAKSIATLETERYRRERA